MAEREDNVNLGIAGIDDSAVATVYAIAAYVASSRLPDNDHFLSDVVFGAATGTIAGRTVMHHVVMLALMKGQGFPPARPAAHEVDLGQCHLSEPVGRPAARS